MDLKVNEGEWNGLGKDAQDRIEAIVGGFYDGAQIVPDPKAPASHVGQQPQGIKGPICKKGCDITQGAAEAACLGLGDPVSIYLCQQAARAAGDECRKKC